jgi:hypothetical protein
MFVEQQGGEAREDAFHFEFPFLAGGFGASAEAALETGHG